MNYEKKAPSAHKKNGRAPDERLRVLGTAHAIVGRRAVPVSLRHHIGVRAEHVIRVRIFNKPWQDA
jgi:hypothetical protein